MTHFHPPVFIVAFITLLLAVSCASRPSSPGPEPASGEPTLSADPGGATETFDDEFDGAAGAAPDPSKWQPDVGGTGWGNRELQYYAPHNAEIDGQGHLAIHAVATGDGQSCWYGFCTYTSAKLITRRSAHGGFAQAYGAFVARIKMPRGAGLLPAFWLLGTEPEKAGQRAPGEIDVVEVLGQLTERIQQHAHGPALDFGAAYALPASGNATEWHTYAVAWSPDRIDWSVDGRTTLTLDRAQAGPGWVFDRPFSILLDLAVGGDWPGTPQPSTEFPATLLVDYVRVYAGTRHA